MKKLLFLCIIIIISVVVYLVAGTDLFHSQSQSGSHFGLTITTTNGGYVRLPDVVDDVDKAETFSFDPGEVVNLEAVTVSGYSFLNWSGDVDTVADVKAAQTTITMDKDRSITANFVDTAAMRVLTVSATVGGHVEKPGENAFAYAPDTVVDLLAVAGEGYSFLNWTSNDTGALSQISDVNSAATTITMKGNYSITANFATTYALTISSTDGGSVTTPGEGAFSYAKGAVVSLVATTDTSSSYEYVFVNWTSSDSAALAAIGSVTSASTTITVNGNWSITANFVRWAVRYDGGSEDQACDVAVDSDGNLYVTGWSYGGDLFANPNPGTDFDYVTVKYDSNLNQVWAKRYSRVGNYCDKAEAIAVGNGKVYVTGESTLCTGAGVYTNSDCLTVAYDVNGNELWAKTYGGSSDDLATAIAADSSYVYVTGVSGDDYVTIKYSSAGVYQWAASYDNGNSDQATAIAIDSGNIYVTGCSDSVAGVTRSDYATIKYSSGGAQQWVARYDGSGWNDAATAIAVDSSGNVYITGYSYDSTTQEDYATVKYSSGGAQQWAARYDAGNTTNEPDTYQPIRTDRATAIAVDSGGNVYVTGQSYFLATSADRDDDYATIKYNSAGVQQWVARYDGGTNLYDTATAIAVDGSGNVYVTGYSRESSASGGSYVTVKYNNAGTELWARTYVGPTGNNNAVAMVINSTTGTVYVTGSSWGNTATDYDYATVMITQ